MKNIILFISLGTSICAQSSVKTEKLKNDFNNNLSKQNTAVFEENKGQMKDQNWKPRPDVLFFGKSEGMNYFIRNNGMSYQLSRVDSWKEEEDIKGLPDIKNKRKVPDQIGTYRVDADWLCFNKDFSIEKAKALPGYNNYYNVPEGVEPALFVKQYEAVTLKNLWNGIDVHYYSTEGFLETDYLVAAGADYRQIQMEIKGADLSIDAEGYLVMKTPFGEIKEGKLKVYQENKLIAANWKLNQKADKIWQVSFDIPDFNPTLALRIDPVVRVWGTYYGGSDFDVGSSCTIDSLGFVYLGGDTNSETGIASGGHQNVLEYNNDGFLVKFSGNGNRLWATYYGGSDYEAGFSIATDNFGNIFTSGNTSSSTGISYNGHQNTYSHLNLLVTSRSDAYLVKFNSNGVRQWGTYYGSGSGNDYSNSVATDNFGNVFICGSTECDTGISYNGHENNFSWGGSDAFLVKFNSNGMRQWGTYYGGSGSDYANACKVDNIGNIFVCGATNSDTGIAYSGHQNLKSGTNYDAFLVKFNSNGVRQWGTYYGGSSLDGAYSISSDNIGNIFICGRTKSDTGIVYNGHQNLKSGTNYDAFLVKFNSNGVRQWGTYYGGSSLDVAYAISVDNIGNVFISGETESDTGISYNGYQNLYIGGGSFYSADAFLVKFNSNGVRQWGTYYGGNGFDFFESVAIDNFGNVYTCGATESDTGISYNGHQNSYGGVDYDAFLVKFNDNGNANPIENLENVKLSSFVYPNPAKEKATILLEGIIDPNDLELEVYDVMGKLIHNDSYYNDNSFEIFVSNWNTGVYIYNISQKGKVISRGKMVVE